MCSKDGYGRWHGCVLSTFSDELFSLFVVSAHAAFMVLSDHRLRNGGLHFVNVLLVRIRRPSDPSATTGHWGHLHNRKGEGDFW